MRLFFLTAALATLGACLPTSAKSSTAGIEALVQRRIPQHVSSFSFSLSSNVSQSNSSLPANDVYTVSNGADGKIHVSGNSPIALASGLRWYLATYAHVDIYWFIGSQLYLAPEDLPRLNSTYHGSSIVPWRYDFNTVTFSYTAAFWDWQDWELQLDWMALRGINLALAWVGYEKILVDVLREARFSDADIASFLSGPAFQAWNRFGNIQGSWGGDLPQSWIDNQFSLNQKIVGRMVELGITPVMPCFTGFVPSQIGSLYPNASFVNGSQWNGFPKQYTNDTFLEPFDPLFTTWQKSFISKQTAAYGNVTNIYTLDQYNENNPYSGDLDYLRNVTSNTIKSLKAADPNAIQLLQGWLFFSSETFWTDARVEAYLSGAANSDMLILDLFSESQPQWQRTNSYYGKPWIWCEVHDYGGNIGLYGQVENVTINPIAALANSSSMVGMGLTMEGQEGNEIMYDILLDQAWSKEPLNTAKYFHDWVSARYNAAPSLPSGLYTAWDTMRTTVYNNTNLNRAQAVTKSIFVLSPNATGLLNRTGHHPTTIQYDPAVLVNAWTDFYEAAFYEPSLWFNEAYTFDLTDITRQVLANAFYPLYTTFLSAANQSLPATYNAPKAAATGEQMLCLLNDIDTLLAASGYPSFTLDAWVNAAASWANGGNTSYYEYNARNQVTLWGPTGQISDYASKQWAGLIGSYYVPRWQRFVEFTLNSTTKANGENDALAKSLLAFEEAWQYQPSSSQGNVWRRDGGLKQSIASAVSNWPEVFNRAS